MLHVNQHHRATIRLLTISTVILMVSLFLFVLPQPAYAVTCSNSRDYGDAPSSYGIACANRNTNIYIGSVAPDEENLPGYQGAGATGDDTNGTPDDEGFLNPLTPIDLAYSYYTWTVPVRNNTGAAATLVGWIDFNGNTTFDTNERANANVPTNAATQNITLTWTIPITASPNISTYARLRIMPTTIASYWEPIGNFPNENSDGEVEDYAVTTVQSIICTPGTSFYFIHGTGSTGNAVIETINISTGVTTTVSDPSAHTNINGLAVDQYRGFIYYQDAADTTTPDGIYYYDIVNNSNGTITDDAGTAPLSLPLGNGWQTASGAFGNGKYYAGIDGNDIGTIYEITMDAAGTVPVSSRVLVTPNAGCTKTTCRGYGDLMIVGNRMYVSLWENATPTSVVIEVYDINSQLRLSRWTYNASGFALQLARDGNGQIYTIASDDGRVYTLNASTGIPDNFPATPVRTIGSIINDASECPILPMDFGDAPTTYSWDAGPTAARHGLNANLRLGNVSGESTIRDLRGMSSTNANGDDTRTYNGTTGGTDDEDSISSLPVLNASAASYTISNIVVFNNTGNNATLFAWIDFNRDGQFLPGERTTVNVPSNPATQTVSLNWSGLSGLIQGPSFLRLRLSTATTTTSSWGAGNDGAFRAIGYAADGEVEDYALRIDAPTAVTLSTFTAKQSTDMNTNTLQKGWEFGAALVVLVGLGIYRRHRARAQGITT